MKRLEQVQKILDEAVQGLVNVGPHGPFWRGLTRDQFVAKKVFGQNIVTLNDPDGSTLIKALEGRSPFGVDLVPPPAGAAMRRMPGGLPPVPPDRIQIIRQWIADGCPDETVEEVLFDLQAGGPADAEVHNAYWRDFDDWAMFNVSDEVQEAIGQIFNVHGLWRAFAADSTQLAPWDAAIRQPDVHSAIEALAQRQMQTVFDHYGRPAALLTLLDGYERFGDNSLPDDALRPQDPRHNMNGQGMWFVWASFEDACLRLDIAPDFWRGHIRALLLGLFNDGIFRGRFTVNGFSADQAGKQAMRQFVRDLADASLQDELSRRFVESGLGG